VIFKCLTLWFSDPVNDWVVFLLLASSMCRCKGGAHCRIPSPSPIKGWALCTLLCPLQLAPCLPVSAWYSRGCEVLWCPCSLQLHSKPVHVRTLGTVAQGENTTILHSFWDFLELSLEKEVAEKWHPGVCQLSLQWACVLPKKPLEAYVPLHGFVCHGLPRAFCPLFVT
jgi:hypothetical protein